MKWNILIAVCLLFVLCLTGCAGPVDTTAETTPPETTPPETTKTPETQGDDPVISLISEYPYSIPMLDSAYVRGGKYAEQNWYAIESRDYIIKNTPTTTATDNMRFGLFKYDISGLAESDVVYAEFEARATKIETSTDVPFNIYLVSDEWDGTKVTMVTRPETLEESPVIEGVLFNKIDRVDVTEFLRTQIRAGKDSFSIMIVQMMDTNSETRIAKDSGYPSFTVYADTEGPEIIYEKQLLESEKKNDAIWKQAEKLYNEWNEKYEKLKAEEAPTAEKIVSDPDTYNKQVETFRVRPGVYDTRTLSALSDYTEKTVKLDKYGGLMDESMKQEATGFFYTTKIGDRWWMIDPLGYPCYIKGMSCIDYAYQKSEYQAAKALEVYGSYENWASATTEHLKNDLYFNIEANSSINKSYQGDDPIPRQIPMGFAGAYGKYVGVNAYVGGSTTFSENNTMPVFDPMFEQHVNTTAQTVRANGYVGDPNIVGYTTDNELPLKLDIIYDYLNLDHTKEVNHYSYAAAWYWLSQMTGKDNPNREDITPEIEQLFLAFLYDRYFDVTTTALRRADPDHMIMGSRFLTVCKDSTWLFRFVSQYLDCITINWYYDWEIDEDVIYNVATNATVPFIVTEFYAMGQENDGNLGNSSGAGFTVKTQAERGDFYQNFTLRLLEAKNCIGWYWFQYIDNDPRNAGGDNTSVDSNKGIYSSNYLEYTDLTEAMATLNRNVYGLIEYFDQK